MKVMLVEDHVPTREQVKTLIGLEKDMEIIAAVGSAEEAIEIAEQLQPDVIVMDILLPGMNGIDASRSILAENPGIHILALSNHSGSALVQAILDVGALGYVRKNRAFEELISAIRTVGAGKQYIGENAK